MPQESYSYIIHTEVSRATRFIRLVFLDHRVDNDVPEVAGARLGRDAGHFGLVLHDEAPLDRQHIQNLQMKFQQNMTSFSDKVD